MSAFPRVFPLSLSLFLSLTWVHLLIQMQNNWYTGANMIGDKPLRSFFLRTLLLVAFSVVGAAETHAASLYFDPPEASIYRGDSVTLGLRLDTDEEECINTVDAIVHYDPAVRAIDVSRGDSILNIWVEEPKIDEVNHTITFAGGIPGGYCGRIAGDPSLTNVIAEIVFRSPGFAVGAVKSPVAQVWVDESSQVLLHDGFGTRANLRASGASLTLLDTPGTAIDDSWNTRVREDTTVPSDFAITLAKEESAFDGKYFITFNSQDKQSGIDHYEVMEEPIEDLYAFSWGRADAPWVRSESPYVLVDQTLNSTIRVKAIDKAGNSTISVFVPDEAFRSLSQDRLFTIMIIGGIAALMLIAIAFIVWRRKRALIAEYDEPDAQTT